MLVSMAAREAAAVGVVTFYTDRAAFLAATSPQAVLGFEGITTSNGVANFGEAYHTGAVTFTSTGVGGGAANNILVVGPNSPTLGVPFDSSILIPNSLPSTLLATFDPGSGLTAVGGYFMNLSYQMGPVRLEVVGGTGGILDSRLVNLSRARAGEPHTFIGYTVTGDTFASVRLTGLNDAPALDEFTYGTAVPSPAGVVVLAAAGVACARRRRGRAR
jgi:hypothetical protein